MGLGKRQLLTKFEVASPSHCRNILGEPKILGSSPSPRPPQLFPLDVILWYILSVKCSSLLSTNSRYNIIIFITTMYWIMLSARCYTGFLHAGSDWWASQPKTWTAHSSQLKDRQSSIWTEMSWGLVTLEYGQCRMQFKLILADNIIHADEAAWSQRISHLVGGTMRVVVSDERRCRPIRYCFIFW